MEPTTSDATSSLLSQLDANLARLDAAAIRLQEQRTALVIQAVAARIMRSHADATSFTIRPRTEPRGWEFDSAAAENGAALRLDEVLIADIDATLRDRLPLSGSTMLTPETQPSEAPHRPRFPIPPNEHDPMVTPASVLDIDTLTEDEFTQIYRTAQDRLDLVGIVRTRGDFDAQLRDLQLRADVPTTRSVLPSTSRSCATGRSSRNHRGSPTSRPRPSTRSSVKSPASSISNKTTTNPARRPDTPSFPVATAAWSTDPGRGYRRTPTPTPETGTGPQTLTDLSVTSR